MSYIINLPDTPSFSLIGMKGYQFQELKNKDLDVYILDVEKGHDTFIISKEITRVYYILKGKGYFTIDGERYNVEPGILIELPPNVEYSYAGNMQILLVSCPRWFKGNEIHTKINKDVGSVFSIGSILSRIGLHNK